MMKILFVVSGTERVAASRYRVYQYLSYLKSQDIEYRVFSTISDFATRLAIMSPEFGEFTRFIYYIWISLERFLRFWPIFFMSRRCDIIFLQRATFPLALGRLLKSRRRKIIFDIDDAIFLPDTPKQNLVSRFKTFVRERELKGILALSDCVVVENDYIKDYVSRYCPEVYKIPGPIDTVRYFIKEKRLKDKEVVLGWIGSPATTGYLHLLDGVFVDILERFENVRIVLIGAGNYSFPDKRVVKKPWRYETEVEELKDFDIGLMPMPDDEWTKGKLGCKMLQYMAVGVPSVVSYTKTNAEIIRDNENGFLVKNESEWIDALSCLIKDPGLRAAIGSAGRRIVEELCSVKENAPKLMAIFNSLKELDEIS
jgi:glycosyltransferase involved in cell wall biosynthesis